jgi:5-methylcytosine-specific restriction endonuclease McrA
LRPRCETAGCGHPAEHVDHIVARSRGGADFDPRNLMALCASCHSRKTSTRDGGSGNRMSTKPVRALGCDASGRPRDPFHRWNIGEGEGPSES